MGKILTHIPGFRTRTPLYMILAGIYYLISVSMTPVSAALGYPAALRAVSAIQRPCRHR